MRDELRTMQLRPLGIGEIFDRAVTLYVQHFVLFSIISGFVVVPLSIAGYFADAQQAQTLGEIFRQVGHPSRPAPVTPAIAPWFFAVIVLALLLSPFMYVAAASAVGSIYEGRPADWPSAYAVAGRHAGGIIMTAVCGMVIIMVVGFAGAIVLGVSFAITALLAASARGLAFVMIVPLVFLALAFIVAVMLCYLAVALAFETIGIEEAPFARAIGSGFSRVFNRSELGKAVLICLAFAALEIGLLLVSAGVSLLLAQLVHLQLLQVIVQAAISLCTTGFIGVLLAVYYYDVRIRREGLDLQAAISSLQTSTQA
jgi:hypothetical protein